VDDGRWQRRPPGSHHAANSRSREARTTPTTHDATQRAPGRTGAFRGFFFALVGSFCRSGRGPGACTRFSGVASASLGVVWSSQMGRRGVKSRL